MSTVAILGCGPSGLIAAHAAEQLGYTVTILSKKKKSIIPGSQHLQGAIPGVTPHYPEYTVEFVRLGTAEGYAQKVYGDPTHPCGWESYRGVHPSWSVQNVYDLLWDRYEERIEPWEFNGLSDMLGILDAYDCVISAIPQPIICYEAEKHFFEGVPYYIKTLEIPPGDHNREIVVWNGLESDLWYRWSILGEKCSIESTQFMTGCIEGRKAIYSNCNCYQDDGIIRVGRWAKWRHGVLLQHVYTDVVNQLAGRK
jgi:hypothetical protein